MRTLMLVSLLACTGISPGYAQGDSDSDAVSKIIAMEHTWGQAYAVKDPNAMDRILDAAFVCVASDGKLMTKADILADVKTSTTQQVLTESMVVHMHGDTAIVTGTFRSKGLGHGKPFSRRERFVDTWIYKNDHWVSITSLVTLAGD
jgi:ketosteroid isomerase-like protein